MSDIKNILIERSVPSHIREDYPLFVDFLKAYYEFQAQTKNPHDIAKNLTDYRKITETLPEFEDYFLNELAPNFPKDIAADKDLLIHNLREFYLNKGNEASYKFLFKILYNEDVEFYYPKTDILRASDGKWYEQKSIKITLTLDTDLLFMNSKQVVGITSGATAIIENALKITDRDTILVELILSEIRGEFVDGEEVAIDYIDENGNTQTITETIYDITASVKINVPGSGYVVGDLIVVEDSDNTEVTKIEVKKVTRGAATALNVDTAGTGYNGEVRRTTIFGKLPLDITFNGDYLPDTPADGSGSGTSGTNYTAYTFDQIITSTDVPGTADKIFIKDSTGSFGSGGEGYVSVVGNNGEILEVVLSEGGDGYEAPITEIETTFGTGGVVSVIGGGGAIESAQLINFPIIKDSDLDSAGELGNLTIKFSDVGDGNAEGILESGVLANYPGRYLNEDGHLSSNKKLQDNRYYQDYSYVLKVARSIDEWRDAVRKIIHPAGLALFGEIEFIKEIDSTTFLDLSHTEVDREIVKEIDSPIVIEEAVVKLYSSSSDGAFDIPVTDSAGNHLIDYEKDSSGTYLPS